MFTFTPHSVSKSGHELRQRVRAFLKERLAGWTVARRVNSWDGFDADFSRAIGAQGWIGMTWPKKFGGREYCALDRFVVQEEMLFAGAPVASHWVADRQSGPLLLRYGTDRQREEILPRIASGELCFCIGLSEPDAGSDVAAIRTRARKIDGGWTISGTKLWTTNAHHAHYMIGLFRTGGEDTDRHAGLSQFLIDMKAPGVTVRPIVDLTGGEHFNEVLFEDVLVSQDNLIGSEGEGWSQVMAELAFERSGPERILSSIQALVELIRSVEGKQDEESSSVVGGLIAQLITLRKMSWSIAGMLEANENPSVEACVVKDLGTGFEQMLPEAVQSLLGLELDPKVGTDLQLAMAHLVRMAPAYTLRGGTREILRGVIARGLGLR